MDVSKRARVICNPASGGGAYDPDEVRAELDGFEVEWIETKAAGDARRLAGEWRDGLLIVAGGDGTVNEVVNGLGEMGFPEGVSLAILPTGTGNDLAATLAISNDPDEAEDTIRKGRVRSLDVGRVRSEGIGERYFINVATGGFGAETTGIVDEDMKRRWGKLTYLRASLEVASKFDVRDARLTLDGEKRTVRAVNVAVGNCRYAGGGWPAAPRANPEDGLLDLVVIEDVGIREVLALTPAALARSDYLDKPGVFFTRATEIRIDTDPGGLEFNADGELIGREPVEFGIVPRALKVIVGPEYVPEPEEEG